MRQAQPSRPCQAPGPAASCEAREHTHLLDLPDDVCGMIYGSIPSSGGESKAAMRHACSTLYRSPAINARLCSKSVDFSRYSGTPLGQMVSKLAAFPRNAALKNLTFMGMKDLDLRQLLALCSQDLRARACLQTVEALTFKAGCVMDERVAAFLQPLFPMLKSLDLNACTLQGSFEDVLMPQLSILPHFQTLKLQVHGSLDGLVQSLTKLEGLQSLDLTFCSPQPSIDIASLTPCHHLKELSLRYCGLVGLVDFLAYYPLRHLNLYHVAWPSGMHMHYTSHTLRTISVDILTFGFPALRAQDFPTLERFAFCGIDWCDGSDNLSDGMIVSKTKDLIAWVARTPFQAYEDDFYLSDSDFALNAGHDWPASLCTAVLVELLPLAPALTDIGCVTMLNWDLNNDGVLVLGELFGGNMSAGDRICPLVLRGDGMHLGDDTGLFKLQQALPRLNNLVLHGSKFPQDLCAALLAAHHAKRSFLVEYGTAGNDEVANEVFEAVARQWYAISSALSGPSYAQLSHLG